jgi:hypothetical protein
MHVYLSLLSVVGCHVEVSVSCLSLVQRSRAECGVSECDREASIMRRPWPTRGLSRHGGGGESCAFMISCTVHCVSAVFCVQCVQKHVTCVNPLMTKRICFR